ncbi:MAG: saccharopine dehydrogenase NADP-binding domain-containing protein [Polyangiales bacterium]
MSRIFLFGATGYQGRLAAEAMVARGLAPVLVGRDEARLRALATSHGGLDHAVADLRDAGSLTRLLGRGDVLVSTVGPFFKHGLLQVEAALAAGAHYLDSSGESASYRLLHERVRARADASSSAVLTACAYDFFPGNAVADLVLRRAGDRAVRVDIGYFGDVARGYRVSAGSQASGLVTMLEPGLFFRGGRLEVAPIFTELGRVALLGAARVGVSMAGTEPLFLPALHPALREIRGIWGWMGPRSGALQKLACVQAGIARIPLAKRAVTRLLDAVATSDGSGPDASLRARSSSYVTATAFDAHDAPLATATLGDLDGFSFTANILAWSAEQLARGALRRAGFTGPVQAFGHAALLQGHEESGFALLEDASHGGAASPAPRSEPRFAEASR